MFVYSILYSFILYFSFRIPTSPVRSLRLIQSLVSYSLSRVPLLVACRLQHWDVQNELTHGLYYEEKLLDRNLTKNFFRQMKACDQTPKLFFNDYQAVDIGPSTEVCSFKTEPNEKTNIIFIY